MRDKLITRQITFTAVTGTAVNLTTEKPEQMTVNVTRDLTKASEQTRLNLVNKILTAEYDDKARPDLMRMVNITKMTVKTELFGMEPDVFIHHAHRIQNRNGRRVD